MVCQRSCGLQYRFPVAAELLLLLRVAAELLLLLHTWWICRTRSARGANCERARTGVIRVLV